MPDDTNAGVADSAEYAAPALGCGCNPAQEARMAIFPCDRGQHRYSGPQRSAYVTWVLDNKVLTVKQRLCSGHFEALRTYCQERGVDLEVAEASGTVPTCTYDGCARPREGAVYVKMYPGGEDYTEFVIDLCAEHSVVVADFIGGGTEMH